MCRFCIQNCHFCLSLSSFICLSPSICLSLPFSLNMSVCLSLFLDLIANTKCRFYLHNVFLLSFCIYIYIFLYQSVSWFLSRFNHPSLFSLDFIMNSELPSSVFQISFFSLYISVWFSCLFL